MDWGNLEFFKSHSKLLMLFVEKNPYESAVLYVCFYALAVSFSIPVATALTFLAGFLFGYKIGLVLAIMSACLGSSILFFVISLGFKVKLTESVYKHPLFNDAKYGINRNLYGYLLFIRLFPIIPFWLANLVPPIVGIKFFPFIVTTFLGILPGTLIIAYTGSQFGIAIGDVEDPEHYLNNELSIFFLFVFLAILSLSRVFAKFFGLMK